MSRQLIVRHEATIDLADAAIWYDKQQAGLGNDLLNQVRATLNEIESRPESFPIDFRYARRALVHRFPYAIYFVIRPEFISVIAILHGSRDRPAQLRTRLP